MNVTCRNLGFREIQILANFMQEISRNGLFDDVPVTFAYDMRNDRAYCTTENGDIVTSDEIVGG